MFSRIFVFVALVAVATSSPLEFVEREGRVVGGSFAPLGRFPYMAATSGSNFFCGAAIINNRWLLSAAHCFTVPQNGIRIRVGSVHYHTGGVVHISSRHVAHPNYDPNSLRADIGVIQSATVIGFNTNVQPIALGSTAIGGGISAMFSGWGTINDATQLTFFQTTTLTQADCRNRAGSQASAILDQKLCTFSNRNQG
jgi:trypsin